MSDKFDKQFSIYNPPATSKRAIGICDVTLRDGEQTAGVSFSLDEKIEIASMLDDLGVDQIQLAEATTPHDIAAGKAICAIPRKNAKIEIMTAMFSRNWKDQVLRAVDCGADVVHSLIPLSPLMRTMYPNPPTNEMLFERAQEVVSFIRDKGTEFINISLLDTSRTPRPLLVTMVDLLCQLGVDRIRFADTVGTASPWGILQMASILRDTIDRSSAAKKPLLLSHTHNDLGFGTANAIAAVMGGVDMVDLSVNGLGDRCGNSDLAQVVIGIEGILDFDTNINVSKLCYISREVSRISGIPIPRNAPIVGDMAFCVEHDAHTLAAFSDPFAYAGLDPKSVGNAPKLVVGKKNGPEFLRIKLQSLGMSPLNPALTQKVLSAIHQRSDCAHGAIISDDEFRQIVSACQQ